MYRLSPKEKEEVEFQLRSLIKKGFITPSHSPFGAPILFKDKPDGSFRMCVDFRALNKQTIKNRFPLPRMDELLDLLTKAKYFTSLDLQQAYNQVQLLPEDREKTAFVTHLGLYEYKVLCFGLANAPATFQSLMNESLEGLLLCDYKDKLKIIPHRPYNRLFKLDSYIAVANLSYSDSQLSGHS